MIIKLLSLVCVMIPLVSSLQFGTGARPSISAEFCTWQTGATLC